MNPGPTKESFSSRDVLFLGLALLVILSIAFLLPVDPNDYWWYLRVGGDILRSGSIPAIDTFTYTQSGQPFVVHSWLSAIIFALLNKAGGISLTVLARGAFIALAYAGIYLLSRKHGSGIRIASLIVVLAALATANNWVVRPQMFTYPLFVTVLMILHSWQQGNQKSTWLLPLISLVWVNLHGSFVMIFIPILIAVIFGKGDRRRLLIILMLTLAATLINPRGPLAWGYVLESLTSKSSLSFSMEWAPPVNQGWQMNLFFAWLLAFIPLAAKSKSQLSRMDWALLLGFGLLALFGQRYVIWFVFILAVLTSKLITHIIVQKNDTVKKTIPALDICLGMLFIILPLALLPGIRDKWWKQAPQPLIDTPVKAVDWLKQRPELPGPLWSEIGFSSYLEYALPTRFVWIDTRFELYPVSQWEDYQDVSNASWNWQSILTRDAIKLLMISNQKQPRLLEALQSASNWSLLYQDEITSIFQIE